MEHDLVLRNARVVDGTQYEEWFREHNVPAVRKMSSISGYRVWRAVDAQVERLPEMAAMLEGWYARVAGEAVVYAVEVRQE